MREQKKASWLLIVAVAVACYAMVTAAQWAFPVKATPTPNLDDRWRNWADEIRQREKTSPTAATPTPGTGVPVVPPTPGR